jgi:transposase
MKDLIKLLDKNLKYISHEIINGCLYIKIASVRSETKCPFCGELSCKVHSAYERSYQDLPIQGMKVILILHKRKMLCQIGVRAYNFCRAI